MWIGVGLLVFCKDSLPFFSNEGNRTKIDNSNVVESYNKIKAWGFIETMPIEYFPMEEAKNKLGGRKLYRPTITRKKGEGSATISNFEIKMVEVQEADYDKYNNLRIYDHDRHS